MFDLEAEIKAWRRQIQSFCHGNGGALDELEDHLREEVASLTRAGRSEQDACAAAIAKLGDPAVLRCEFAKIDRLPTLDRIAFGAMLSTASLIVATFLITLIARGQRVWNQPVLTIHVVTITLGYLAGLFAAAFAGYTALRTFLAKRNIPALTRVALKLVRISCIAAAALTLIGFVLGVIWANDAWGKPFNMDPREIGGLLVATSFVVASLATVRNTFSTQTSMGIALAAGATVILAWFGAAAHAANFPPLLTAITLYGSRRLQPAPDAAVR
jgi:ABC-type transport system involved in cytochrome c biogenesis permease subunit